MKGERGPSLTPVRLQMEVGECGGVCKVVGVNSNH